MKPIYLRIEKKGRRGKIVTILEGFTGSQASVEELARKIKISCGTGGTVKKNSIELQGDFRKQALAFFQNQGFLINGF